MLATYVGKNMKIQLNEGFSCYAKNITVNVKYSTCFTIITSSTSSIQSIMVLTWIKCYFYSRRWENSPCRLTILMLLNESNVSFTFSSTLRVYFFFHQQIPSLHSSDMNCKRFIVTISTQFDYCLSILFFLLSLFWLLFCPYIQKIVLSPTGIIKEWFYL